MLGILLEEKGLLQKQIPGRRLDYFVVLTDEQFSPKAIEITARLRRAGFAADFSYKSANLGKQLGQASILNAQKCVIIGEELRNEQIIVKDMTTGKQELVDLDRFFK